MKTATAINSETGIKIGHVSGLRAAIFDFNGTITDDEELQYQVYADTFAQELGVTFRRDEYFRQLAGRPDSDILASAFARSHVNGSKDQVDRVSRMRVLRYLDRVRSASPVRPGTLGLIKALWPHMPMAVVTGAPREEALGVLDSAGLSQLFATIVTTEDVTRGKPNPEGFLLAYQRLRTMMTGLQPWQVVVFEDSLVGINAARAAGMRCIGAHLQACDADNGADQTVDALDEALLMPHWQGQLCR